MISKIVHIHTSDKILENVAYNFEICHTFWTLNSELSNEYT